MPAMKLCEDKAKQKRSLKGGCVNHAEIAQIAVPKPFLFPIFQDHEHILCCALAQGVRHRCRAIQCHPLRPPVG